MDDRQRRLFTIGHSNHTLEIFLKLLSDHAIKVLADVRSQPYSKYVRQFGEPELKKALTNAGVNYIYLGKELGGKPETPYFYDDEGYVLYGRVAGSQLFLQGLHRLQVGITKFRIAVMCSEEDPVGCHRRLLVGRALSDEGIVLYHIRGDGRVQTEEQIIREQSCEGGEGFQLGMPGFENCKEVPWRSVKPIRSVSQSDEPRTFLEP